MNKKKSELKSANDDEIFLKNIIVDDGDTEDGLKIDVILVVFLSTQALRFSIS